MIGHVLRRVPLALVVLSPLVAWQCDARASDLIVAVPAPLSGPRAALGASIHAAVALVAADAATEPQAGAPAQRVEAIYLDDGCDPGLGQKRAAEIAAGPATAVIGHPCANVARAVAATYAKAGRLFIAAGATLPRLTGALRLPALQDQGAAIGHLLADVMGARADMRVAVVRDKTQLNRTLSAQVEATLKARSIDAVVEVFSGGDKDFSALAQRLQAGRVTHVALLAFTIEGALIARELAAVLPNIEMVGPDHLAQPDFAGLAGTAAARVQVLLPTTVAAYGARFAGADAFSARLRAIGVVPTREALETAAALQALVQAVRATDDRSAAGVAARLATPRETLLGPLAFDAAGATNIPYWLASRWRDGALHVVP